MSEDLNYDFIKLGIYMQKHFWVCRKCDAVCSPGESSCACLAGIDLFYYTYEYGYQVYTEIKRAIWNTPNV